MKLYHKQLNSLADLKRERYLMKYAKNVHHLDDLLALDPKFGKKKKKKKADEDDDNGSNPLSMIMGLLGGGTAVSGLGLLGNKHLRRFFVRRLPKKSITNVAKEVFFGYLKWKAIELSYGIIVSAVRKKKEKKRARALADAHHPVHRYAEQPYSQTKRYR